MKKSHRNIGSAKASREIGSPVGRLCIAANDTGLTHLLFVDNLRTRPEVHDAGGEAAAILNETERQLESYFEGGLKEFNLPLAPEGTDFQLLVWSGLLEVPYGATVSYGELARRIGRPSATRAVGAANGANPIPIIVPCHRVIGSDGSLTGFGGGMKTKNFLLAHEGVRIG